MALVKVPSDNVTLQDRAEVTAFLAGHGIGYERWTPEHPVPADAPADALLAAYARAFGAHGETVEETAQFGPAFERCVASGKTSLIEIRIDPQAITTQTTLDALRAKAMKR